jgi:hypothetical protein
VLKQILRVRNHFGITLLKIVCCNGELFLVWTTS